MKFIKVQYYILTNWRLFKFKNFTGNNFNPCCKACQVSYYIYCIKMLSVWKFFNFRVSIVCGGREKHLDTLNPPLKCISQEHHLSTFVSTHENPLYGSGSSIQNSYKLLISNKHRAVVTSRELIFVFKYLSFAFPNRYLNIGLCPPEHLIHRIKKYLQLE